MANIMFSSSVQLHSGGIDLAYPHHHNEVLQSNSFHQKENVFEHFIHAGYLNFDGVKMSQSLGNYVKVSDFLKDHSINTLRLMFLLMRWDKPADLTESIIIQAKALEHRLFNFTNELKHKIKTYVPLKPSELEQNMHMQKTFEEYDDAINKHIATNFKFHKALKNLEELIVYMYTYWEAGSNVDITVLDKIQKLINTITYVGGLNFNNDKTSEETKWAEAIVDIRDDVRMCATKIKEDTKTTQKMLFDLSDKIRDKILPKFGYELQDTTVGSKLSSSL